MRRVPKRPPTCFSAVAYTDVGISSKNVLTLSFNPFATSVSNLKTIPSARTKLLDLNQDHPSKKCFLRLNVYNIEVMLTSLIEMLELPNLSHMTTFTK